jgi:hypothetical protein
MTSCDSQKAWLALPVYGQKSSEIGFGYSNDAAEVVGNKLIAVDPAPYGARANAQHFRDVGYREEVDLNAPAAATRNRA